MPRKISPQEQKRIATQRRRAGITTYEQQEKAKPQKPKLPSTDKKELTAIRHTCGHVIGHNLRSVPPAERAQQRQHYQTSLCVNCERAIVHEQQRQVTHTLPPLVGERADILDANRARTQLVPLVKREIREQITAYQCAVQEDRLSLAQCERLEAILLRAEKNFLRQTSAKWWLSITNKNGKEIVRYLIGKIRQTERKRAAAVMT